MIRGGRTLLLATALLCAAPLAARDASPLTPAAGGAERSLTLCYPPEADAGKGFISVLSPLGTALLGLRVGETAQWRGADGKPAEGVVRAIEFQPEANGDYTD